MFVRVEKTKKGKNGTIKSAAVGSLLRLTLPDIFSYGYFAHLLGLRVETCPISGTIERGSDPLEDAEQVKKLLSNKKEESELTMCTDVDRNDKSRICLPGTVKILGRRQIEMYSKLIHTVDHVEGYLSAGFDSLDAFLCHTWAVTVTGILLIDFHHIIFSAFLIVCFFIILFFLS